MAGMTRSHQRFTLAIVVLTLNAGLIAALIYLALQGKHVTGESILYIVVGGVMAWGAQPLQFYFGTSESSVHKTEVMDRMAGSDGEGQ